MRIKIYDKLKNTVNVYPQQRKQIYVFQEMINTPFMLNVKTKNVHSQNFTNCTYLYVSDILLSLKTMAPVSTRLKQKTYNR